MNKRERFHATMNYQERDRVPLIDLGFWGECFEVWRSQGLPDWVNVKTTDEYFGMDGFWRYYLSPEATDGHALVDRGMIGGEGVRVGLTPLFDNVVLEDRGDRELVQLGDGCRVLRHKKMSSIPKHEGHLLVDRASWEKYYKPRLRPDHLERYPKNWAAFSRLSCNAERDYLLILPGGSLYGWIRNWMGLEAVSYLVYDDPAWFEEMVDTVAECIIGVLQRTLAEGGQFDACFIWEDMSYNAGPLISPKHFRQFLSPRYRRITELLHRFGVNHVIVDSDGKLDELIPLFLDVGVNCILPLEIGTTGADAIKYRQRFGCDLRIIGGFDKRILAASKQAISKEVERLTDLVEEGGYIPTCDHKIPPNVPLANYCYFIEMARERWTF